MTFKNNHGSTIIEAMIAVAILGCALVAVVPSYISAMSAAQVQKQYAQALILLENELASRIYQGFVDKDFNVQQQQVIDGIVYKIHAWARQVPGRSINLLTINVQWRARSIEIATYLFDAGEKKDRRDAL